MSDASQKDPLIGYICEHIFDIQGRLHANEVVLHSLVSVICENAPELIGQLKSKISDVTELKTTMQEVPEGPIAEKFKKEIEQNIRLFSLIETASKYSPTRIKIKNNF